MEERVNELLRLIKEYECGICYTKIECDRELLNCLQKEKAMTNELNISLKKYLELKKDFKNSLERFLRELTDKNTKGLYDDIDFLGIQNDSIIERLKEVKTEYQEIKEKIHNVQSEIDLFEMRLEDLKSEVRRM